MSLKISNCTINGVKVDDKKLAGFLINLSIVTPCMLASDERSKAVADEAINKIIKE